AGDIHMSPHAVRDDSLGTVAQFGVDGIVHAIQQPPPMPRTLAALRDGVARRRYILYHSRSYMLYLRSERGKVAMGNEPLLLGGISDDFTGGLELASMMARDGLRTRLLTRLDRASGLS